MRKAGPEASSVGFRVVEAAGVEPASGAADQLIDGAWLPLMTHRPNATEGEAVSDSGRC